MTRWPTRLEVTTFELCSFFTWWCFYLKIVEVVYFVRISAGNFMQSLHRHLMHLSSLSTINTILACLMAHFQAITLQSTSDVNGTYSMNSASTAIKCFYSGIVYCSMAFIVQHLETNRLEKSQVYNPINLSDASTFTF